ncbi:hypothetical protein BDR22DRAFT_894425 [Usnea florida]
MSRATLLSTAQTAIQGYNTWTPTSILAYRAPHCEHHILPTSLNRPPLNNAQYAAYFVPLMSHFRSFRVTVHDTVVDEVARKVVMRASSTAETDVGPYANEYVLVMRMTEDGRLVERFDEFVDSAVSAGFMPRLREKMGV